jgi:hypothetical protein
MNKNDKVISTGTWRNAFTNQPVIQPGDVGTILSVAGVDCYWVIFFGNTKVLAYSDQIKPFTNDGSK